MDLERMLRIYAELTVKVGLNLQPRQRLLIIGPVANGGCRSKRRRSSDISPRRRTMPARGWSKRCGATKPCSPRGCSTRRAIRSTSSPHGCRGARRARRRRDTRSLSIYANDPDLLKDYPADVVAAVQQATARSVRPFREHISRNQTNWAVVAAAAASWAARVYPGPAAGGQVSALVERDRTSVPARSAGSDRRLGNAPRGPRRAHRSSERESSTPR